MVAMITVKAHMLFCSFGDIVGIAECHVSFFFFFSGGRLTASRSVDRFFAGRPCRGRLMPAMNAV